MTRDAARLLNRAARDWAAREPEVAVCAVLAHPAADAWTASATPAEAAVFAAMTSPASVEEAARRVVLADGGTTEDAELGARTPGFREALADARGRVCRAVLEWASETADGDGLTVLADARAKLAAADTQTIRQLPRFARVAVGEARLLPGFEVGGLPPVRDAVLPGFEVAASVPSWLLSVYDQAGGVTDTRGRGAPWALRLFVGALLSLPIEFRDGRDQRMALTTGALGRWLLPGGWDRRPAAFDRLLEALRRLDRLRVPVGRGRLRVVDCLVEPSGYNRGRDPVVLRVSIPGGAARGAPVDWDRLTGYGAESAPIYRAYLSVCTVLDYAARSGRALTQSIPAPVLDAKGQPRRRKGGKIVRSPVARVPNPAARYVGWLSANDVRRMVGLAADHHENRRRALDALQRLEDDKLVSIERGTGRQRGLVRLWGAAADVGDRDGLRTASTASTADGRTVTTGDGAKRDNRCEKA